MSDRSIPEAQARRLWQRATELQASAETAAARELDGEPEPSSSLQLSHVIEAAEAAGIHPDFVRLALAESRLPDASQLGHEGWVADWVSRIVSKKAAVELSRFIPESPQRVLDALLSVATGPPFQLDREELIGVDPLRDGVIVLRIAKGSRNGSFKWIVDWAGLRVLLVTVRAESGGTRVWIRAPEFRRGLNLPLAGATVAFTGWGGAAAGAGLSAAVTALAGGVAAVAALPVVAGGLAGGALGVAAYRGLYNWVFTDAEVALQRMLNSVAAAARLPILPAGSDPAE